MLERSYKLVPAPYGDTYLTDVGNKLLAMLPPSSIKYTFQIYESSDLNAFGIAGGRIYISTKMVSRLRNEDELAALLAHEIGHIATHQQAEIATAEMHSVGINSVSTSRDIERSFMKIMSSPDAKSPNWSEETGQDTADQVAIYAMTKAGYRPSAFGELFDRTTGNNGKKGNRLLDILGFTSEANRRYRAGAAMAQKLPLSCIGERRDDPVRFSAWLKHVAERDTEAESESGADLALLKLNSPLGSDINILRFSPDGNYVLAQDASTVTVIQRFPLKVLFQVPTLFITTSWFTPDSKAITFVTGSLKVEVWDIATQKRVATYEPSYPEECNNIFLATDGRTLACATADINNNRASLGLVLLDTATSNILWQKKDLAVVTSYTTGRELRNLAVSLSDNALFNYAQTPDGRILLIGAGDQTVGFDLEKRQQVELPGSLKHLGYSHFAFVGSDQLVVQNLSKPSESTIYAYPSGAVLKHLTLGNQQIVEISRGNAVVLSPIKGSPAGLFDLDTMNFLAVSTSPTMDLYEHTLARQTPTGNLQMDDLSKPGEKPVTVEIPRRRLGRLWAGDISPDGQYLILSVARRSAMWNLKTNKRMVLMRPFVSAYFAGERQLYVDFAKDGDSKRALGSMDMGALKLDALPIEVTPEMSMAGGLLLNWKQQAGKYLGSLTAAQLPDNKQRWSMTFPDGLADYQVRRADKTGTLWWYVESPGGKRVLKDFPALKVKASGMINKRAGLVVQQFDTETGAILRTGVIEHVESSEASYKYVSRTVTSDGEYVLVSGDGRVVVYHMPDGLEVDQFFGEVVDHDLATTNVAVVNRENELRVRDIVSGEEKLERTFATPVRFVKFVPVKKQMLVLTADENLHTLAVP